MIRAPSWPEALYTYLDSRRDMPFTWGTNDCASFAVGAVEVMTGERLPLPTYSDAATAARLLADRPLRARVNDLLAPEIVPAMAQRGDLALLVLEGRPTLAVMLDEWVAGPGEAGLLYLPRMLAVTAWSI